LMICGTNPNMVNEAAATPTIVHTIVRSFYSSLSLPILRLHFYIAILSPPL
jgi:hypothetical protein